MHISISFNVKILNYFRKIADSIYRILEQAFRANVYENFVQWFIFVAQKYKTYLKNEIKKNKNQKNCAVCYIVLEKLDVINLSHIVSHLFTKLTQKGFA